MWFVDLVEGFAVVAAVGVYLLPTFVAIGRDARDMGIVFIIDVLFGWTVIGWIRLRLGVREHVARDASAQLGRSPQEFRKSANP
jgi:hypothetical protein